MILVEISLTPIFFVIVSASLLITLYLIYKSYSEITSRLKNVSKQVWLALVGICILGFILRAKSILWEIDAHSVDWWYLNNAYNFANGIDPPVQERTWAYSLFLSIFFRLFGSSILLSSWINIMLSIVVLVLLFAFLYILFKNSGIALIGASFFAIDTHIIKYTSGPSPNAFYYVTILLALLYAYFVIIEKNQKLFFPAVFLFSVPHTVRYEFLPESILLFFLTLFATKDTKKQLLASVLFLVILIPSVYTAVDIFERINYYAQIDSNSLDSSHSILTFERLTFTIPVLLSMYGIFFLKWHIVSLLAIFGLIYLLCKKRTRDFRILFFILVWWIVQNASYIVSRVQERYVIYGYLPFLILLAYFSYVGIRFIAKQLSKENLHRTTSIAVIVVLLPFIFLAYNFEHTQITGHHVPEIKKAIEAIPKSSPLIIPGFPAEPVANLFGDHRGIQFEELYSVNMPVDGYLLWIENSISNWQIEDKNQDYRYAIDLLKKRYTLEKIHKENKIILYKLT